MFNENLITANKYLVKQDMEQIENYIKRRNWQMDTADGTSARFMPERPTCSSATFSATLWQA